MWAIAIHGGASGDHSRWSQDKITARESGLENALKAGKGVLATGGSAIDAVQAAIVVLEDDASFNAGRGAVKTDDGRVELDASIMDGSNLQCGAIAGLTCAKNPILVANLVKDQTQHVLLVGTGADEFAKRQQVDLVEPEYFFGRFDNRYRRGPDKPHARPHLGTVGCVALDDQGNLAAGTSTGGTSNKLPGRVGDSPIIGAGTFADNDTCAVSGTGIGEEYIRNAVAYDVAAQVRYKNRSLDEAIKDNLTRRLKEGDGGIIGVDRSGMVVLMHNTPSMSCGAADANGRFETHFVVDE